MYFLRIFWFKNSAEFLCYVWHCVLCFCVFALYHLSISKYFKCKKISKKYTQGEMLNTTRFLFGLFFIERFLIKSLTKLKSALNAN